jgi:tRNA threonylcarbamoyl adenosine modification protein YjeE
MQLHHHNLTQGQLERLAAEFSLWARPGFAIMLEGDLGSGKSTFARAFLRALAGNPDLEVPSPTFSLMQIYDELRVPAAHLDLYRLANLEEVRELGIEDMVRRHVMLVEWPDRLAGWQPEDSLIIRISGTGDRRDLSVEPHGRWVSLLQRSADINGFLANSAAADAARQHFEGDASARRYEILATPGEPVLLMDMPELPDGPVIKNNKPYSRIAHLAEDIRAVIAVNRQLLALGYSAPKIYAYDLERGLALIEYLPGEVYGKMVLAGADMREPMKAATEVLADMAGHDWPEHPVVEEGLRHHVQVYDREALLIEVDLLPSWYWPYRQGSSIPAGPAEEFSGLWSETLAELDGQRRIWTIRDYHSPNLLWLPERKGLLRVGIIDSQDCVMGHPAYDLASLLQDARVDIDPAVTLPLLDHYCTLRKKSAGFDEAGFRCNYAILGAQRSTKILGIFARLYKRDNKPAYLKHMPRVAAHLRRNLEHPALARLKAWYARHLQLEQQT